MAGPSAADRGAGERGKPSIALRGSGDRPCLMPSVVQGSMMSWSPTDLPLGYSFDSPRKVLSDPERAAHTAMFAPLALTGPLAGRDDPMLIDAQPGAPRVGDRGHRPA